MRHLLVAASVVLFASGAAQAQDFRTINGSVRDADTGEALLGTVVTVKGTDNSTFVEDDGKFSLPGAPTGAVTLVFTSPGHGSREVEVGAGESSVKVTMTIAVSDIIVISTRAPQIVRTNLSNGASTVKGEDVARATPQTVDGALQGKVAGANIQSNSGAPGGGLQVRLRGVSTITGQADPLFVVDGVIVSNVAIPNGIRAVTLSSGGSNASSTQDNQVNRIADLNPNDIESIEVLKGASASALYGSKASNGVVLITTKRGRGGKTTASVTQRFGVSTLANTIGSRKFNSLEEAIGCMGDACDQPGALPPGFGMLASMFYQQGRSFDHEEELASQREVATETAAAIAGGVGTGSYYANVSVRHEPGIIPNTGYDKQNGRLAFDQDFGRGLLKISGAAHIIHTAASRSITNNDNSGTSHYMVLPFTPSFLDLRKRDDGTFPQNPFIGSLANPLQTVELMDDVEDVWRLLGSVNAALRLFDEGGHTLHLTGGFGIDRFQQEDVLNFPPALFFEADDGLLGTAINADSQSRNMNFDANVVWKFRPPSGGFTSAASFGAQFEDRELETVYVVARNLTAGQMNVDYGTNITVTERREHVRDPGLYLQEEMLLLDNSLSLLGALRLEQSSVFGDTSKFYLYPKLAATYNIPGLPKQIELLRPRVAYGEAGNQPRFGQKFTPLTGVNNIQGNSAIELVGTAGSDLIPERQREIEIGVDGIAFDGRGTLELTFYQKTITDMLLPRALAPSTGFTTQFFNGGELRNRGLELMLQVVPVSQQGFEWTARGTFSLNRSKIVDLPVPTFLTGGFGTGLGAFRIEEGASATQIVGNDGPADPNMPIVVRKIGDTEPDFRIGLFNSFTWKGIGLSFFFDWQQGSDIINLTRFLYDLGANSPDFVGAGQERLRRQGRFASTYVEDATYIKLREIELYYDLPESVTKQLGPMKTARFSLTARNLLTISDYSGLDPEVSNFGNQPIARNIDVAPFPPSKSFWFSVTAGF